MSARSSTVVLLSDAIKRSLLAEVQRHPNGFADVIANRKSCLDTSSGKDKEQLKAEVSFLVAKRREAEKRRRNQRLGQKPVCGYAVAAQA